MPLFRYQAVNQFGKNAQGIIDADSLSVAKDKLCKQQLFITSVIPLKEKKDSIRFPPTMLLSFTKEVATLLQAGLPLYESLLTIEEKYKKHPAHPLFLDLCDHLKEGGSLSTVLKKYSSTFDPIYLSMIKVGEQSGNLVRVFEQLSQLIEREQKLKKQVIGAVAYPAFLASFCVLVVCALLFFIVPSMKELFEGRPVHSVTATVLGISAWTIEHGNLLAMALGAGCIGSVWGWRYPKTRLFLYERFSSLPFIKTLLLHASLMRFSRSMSMLLSGGVPLLNALQLSKGVAHSPLLELAVSEVEKKVLQGERLSVAFHHSRSIPPLVLRMLSLSEETGKMQEAFLNLAQIYDEEMEKHLSQLSAFLQPALLIVLGAIVGLVVLSILLPLTDVSSFSAR